MIYVKSLSAEYCNFEYDLKRALDRQKPDPAMVDNIFESKCDDSLVILVNEIFCRSVLLVARSVKTCFSATMCILSPISMLSKGLIFPPNLAWKRFCKEARYFAADSFEFIGVVACSILLLPCPRGKNHPLLKAQAWIEKKAEWISGEKSLVNSIQETIDAAEAKKKLFLQVRYVIEVGKEEFNKWVDKDIDFDDIICRMNVSQHRRISRNYESLPSREKLNEILTGIAAIVSDKIAPVAIPKQKNTLLSLKQLLCPNNKEELNHLSCNDSDSLETKLTIFQQIQSEIDQTIEQLHEIHDPSHVLGMEIKDLSREICQTCENIIRESVLFGGCKGGIAELYCEFKDHFFLVRKKFAEITYIYSYKNVTQSGENFSQTFVPDLLEQMAECRKLLKDKLLTWGSGNTTSLDRQMALKIFSLTETATPLEIRKAYRRLSRIHHPDKGGKPDVFKTIHALYEILLSKETVVLT